MYQVDRSEYPAEVVTEFTPDYKRRFPNATVLRNATNVYNCHSWAWYKQSLPNIVWLKYCDTYHLDVNSYEIVIIS